MLETDRRTAREYAPPAPDPFSNVSAERGLVGAMILAATDPDRPDFALLSEILEALPFEIRNRALNPTRPNPRDNTPPTLIAHAVDNSIFESIVRLAYAGASSFSDDAIRTECARAALIDLRTVPSPEEIAALADDCIAPSFARGEHGYLAAAIATYSRRLVRYTLSEITAYLGEGAPVAVAIPFAIDKLGAILQSAEPARESTLAQVLESTLQHLSEGDAPGLPIGLRNIDARSGGAAPGQLWVVASRPGHGKSIILWQASVSLALAGHRGMFVSLEMGGNELAVRALASASGYAISSLRGRLDPAVIAHLRPTVDNLSRDHLLIRDSSASIEEIVARTRSLHTRHGLAFLAVDYLQLIESSNAGRNASRADVVATITRRLKLLARELSIPVLTASQLNRENTKGDRRPKLSDLRESGSIEQDADVVILLHQEDDAKKSIPRDAIHPIEIQLAKCRQGGASAWSPAFREGAYARIYEA